MAAALLPYAIAAAVIGTGVSAYGSIESGQAQAAAANYNAKVAAQNAQLARQNATLTAESGNVQAAAQQQKTRQEVGAIEASQAASNVDVGSGSAVDVRSSAAALGELNAITIRSNATREAYGQQTQSTGFTNQATLDQATGSQAATAGALSGAGSLLSGAGNLYMNYLGGKGLGGGTNPDAAWATATTGG